MSDPSSSTSFHDLLESVKRLVTLQLDYARLTAAEKMTILLSTIAFYAIVVILGMVFLFFVSIGIGHWLSETVARDLAYLYVAGFYLVLFILVFVFRKKLFVNPTARFISKLFVKPPEDPEL